MEALKAILAIVGALFLALFAKRYSDLKKREAALRKQKVEDEKHKVIFDNNHMPIGDIVDRENDRFSSGVYKRRREDS